jgi:TolB-like protein
MSIRIARRAARGVVVLFALSASVARAQQPVVPAGTGDSRPTVAVLYFHNGALVGNDDYAPLSKGMAELLITELARNPSIRVIERDRLQRSIAEQKLESHQRMETETAVRLGRVLGAQHVLMGAFVLDARQNMRVDVRSVNAATSRVEYIETVEGTTDRALAMVRELGAKVTAGLKLPAPPARVAKDPAGSAATSGQNQFRAVMLLSRALEQQDRGNTAGAIALYRNALEVYPGFERARVLLASLGK